MATRIFDDKQRSVGRTEFQLHVSQFQLYYKSKSVLRDFTEFRLKRYIEDLDQDHHRKALIEGILEDYVKGKIAVAWKAGEPVYVRMNKIT